MQFLYNIFYNIMGILYYVVTILKIMFYKIVLFCIFIIFLSLNKHFCNII